jgi:hypothetical protein
LKQERKNTVKKFSTVMLLTLGFGFLTVVLSSIHSRPAIADDIKIKEVAVVNTPSVNATITSIPRLELAPGQTVTTPTHLGVLPAALVTLWCNPSKGIGAGAYGQCASYCIVDTNGMCNAVSAINGTWIITDVEWTIGGVPSGYNSLLALEPTPTSTTPFPLYLWFGQALADPSSRAGGSVHLTAGFQLTQLPYVFLQGSTGYEAVETLEMWGYQIL